MRLVFLGPFGLAPKGTMRARALPLARALARLGHEVTVIMPPWQRPEEADRAWEDAVPGLRLVNVSLGGLRLPGLGHLIVAARMARLALALEPDVVHAFKPKAYSHLALLLLRLRRGLTGAAGPRLILDSDDWEGPGGWNDLEPYPAWQRRFFAWQERAGLGRHADAVTVASRALETLVWSLGAPPARVLYLPNAIDDAFPEASPPPTALGEGAGGSAPPPRLPRIPRPPSSSTPVSSSLAWTSCWRCWPPCAGGIPKRACWWPDRASSRRSGVCRPWPPRAAWKGPSTTAAGWSRRSWPRSWPAPMWPSTPSTTPWSTAASLR
ncbi:MAG: glycosyltransferase [Ardenticatenia bacterium]|nr:glycosyltransferase [Ardenticatenia bacterium]